MSFKDQHTHYGSVSRFNHWIGGLVVLGMLAVGLYFNDMPRGDEKIYWLRLHISFGGLVFIFLLFRVFWRLLIQSPEPVKQEKFLHVASRLTHATLLTTLFIMAVSGPLLVWTRGTGINVFDWFIIPTPIGKMPELHEWMETIHVITSKVMLAAITIHVLATIKHQFIDKDQILSRMIKSLRKASSPDKS